MKKFITITENIVEMFAIAFTVVFFLVMIIMLIATPYCEPNPNYPDDNPDECTYFGVN